MARKDDPVFNVKFVQLVESQPCLWNYTHPGYSKKEEVQKAWQHVANEIKDTVRNSRERWRTIRSSFLRSLKLARTQTGRGKRKYYLSKYLQFLIPYTKSRACHKQPSGTATATPNGGMVLRKPSTSTTAAAATYLALTTQPMTRIGHMRLLGHHHHHQQHHHQQQEQARRQPSRQLQLEADEDTKDSRDEEDEGAGAAEAEDEQQAQAEEQQRQQQADGDAQSSLRLQAIKVEHQQQYHQQQQQAQQQPEQQQQHCGDKLVAAAAQHSLVSLPVSMAAALRHNMDWTMAEWLKGSANQLQYHGSNNNSTNNNSSTNNNNNNNTNNNNNNNTNNNNNNMLQLAHAATPPPAASTPAPAAATAAAGLTLAQPDADYSFLISLHPYLKEMSGKQNRRFRQKVVGLIDNVLDNIDV